jgi:hypothetical protein
VPFEDLFGGVTLIAPDIEPRPDFGASASMRSICALVSIT